MSIVIAALTALALLLSPHSPSATSAATTAAAPAQQPVADDAVLPVGL